MNPVYLVDAVRTPVGRYNGGLAPVRPDDLAAHVVRALLSRSPRLDPAVLNPQGGAIALGHPLGASGARLAGTVAHQLARRGSGTGVATLCIGVGQGLALVLER
ncbi:acetyl-CoA acyltransferase [Streptomyces sp. 2231.1]|nr:acetyl-CoA acyltransferase [Streptomyces sp. 2231.1]